MELDHQIKIVTVKILERENQYRN